MCGEAGRVPSLRRSRRDVHVQGVVVDDGAVRPGGLHELAPPHGRAGRGGEPCQDPELRRGQLTALVAAPHRMGRRVEPHPVGLHGQVGAAAADQGAEPRDELGEGERLRHVVVAARREPGQPVGERVAGGQEEHRRANAAGAQCLDDVAAVGIGQTDVDDERVGLVHPDLVEQLAGGRRRRHVKAFLAEAAAQQRTQLRVVLQHDHPRLHHSTFSIARAGVHGAGRAPRRCSRPARPRARPGRGRRCPSRPACRSRAPRRWPRSRTRPG